MTCPARTIWNCREGDRVFSSIRGWYGVIMRRVDDTHAEVFFTFHEGGQGVITYPLDCLVLANEEEA